MQTFLPYPDFKKSAIVLDNKRLGKQRVECLQLLRGQWSTHPASKMWRGHEWALGLYGLFVCEEWISRGFKDTCREKINEALRSHKSSGFPWWLGNAEFHLSHQSNLVRKLPNHYKKYFPNVQNDLPYVWPGV